DAERVAVSVVLSRRVADRGFDVRVQSVQRVARPAAARIDVRARQSSTRADVLRCVSAGGLGGGGDCVLDGTRRRSEADVADFSAAVRVSAGYVYGGGAVVQGRDPRACRGVGEVGEEGYR